MAQDLVVCWRTADNFRAAIRCNDAEAEELIARLAARGMFDIHVVPA